MLTKTSTHHNLNLLWRHLKTAITNTEGENALAITAKIKDLCENLRTFQHDENKKQIQSLFKLAEHEIIPTVRTLNQFLNLANIVEQHSEIARNCECLGKQSLEKIFIRLKKSGLSNEQITKQVHHLFIELVLTAHPTEVTRRSFISKHREINRLLNKLSHTDLNESEREKIDQRLGEIIALMWHTNEIRFKRPTPLEEAKAAIVVLEQSLWHALPEFLKNLDDLLQKHCNSELSLDDTMVKFSSWIGGDRDGNPLVTQDITAQILLLNRLKISQLLFNDLQYLVDELSVKQATEHFCQKYQVSKEPYRQVFKQLRDKLAKNVVYYNDLIENGHSWVKVGEIIHHSHQLLSPLLDAYHSLRACNMEIIAKGALRNTIYRVQSFGVVLMKLDIRQESARHSAFLAEITTALKMGDYNLWTEDEKLSFLRRELTTNRPLIPRNYQLTNESLELFNTARLIAENGDAIASYVISMAKNASDVLAVMLILKEAGVNNLPPIVPLFETLEDLKRCNIVMQQLFEMSEYRHIIKDKQMVMIGYSDSAKDAGMMAASWSQYRAQEQLLELAKSYGITLMLFHGRGGTIGRGGAPAHAALLSQPPHSLEQGLRVTEQGEMIRFKLGLPEIAVETLSLYASAILEANIFPPPKPCAKWRAMMDKASAISCKKYRDIVRFNSDFIAYFRSATPEQELSKLPLGSRPAKRTVDGGIESLRAIPWIFAWTQNRLMLPTWLGAGDGLRSLLAEDEQQLRNMCQDWPFFSTRIGMLEMIFSKVDPWLSSLYEKMLVSKELHPLGKHLRAKLAEDIQTLKNISHKDHFMGDLPFIAESIKARNLYTDPLNLLQIVLLSQLRSQDNPPDYLDEALMITIAGIAAGMRNTG